jgi:kynurenine formamidase
MSQSAGDTDVNGLRSITYTRVVDLSMDIHPGMALWPGDPAVEFDDVARLDAHAYYLRRFTMSEHGGTHMNAPNSFHPAGASIDEYPPESLISRASVINLLELVPEHPDYEVTIADIDHWEERHGPIQPGSIVLLHTGWSAVRNPAPESPGPIKDEGHRFPGFGYDAAHWLLDDRHAVGLGTDAPGVESGSNKAFTVNKLVLEQRRIVLESLINLDRLPPTGATLVIGVLRLAGGTGSPASVLALVP